MRGGRDAGCLFGPEGFAEGCGGRVALVCVDLRVDDELPRCAAGGHAVLPGEVTDRVRAGGLRRGDLLLDVAVQPAAVECLVDGDGHAGEEDPDCRATDRADDAAAPA